MQLIETPPGFLAGERQRSPCPSFVRTPKQPVAVVKVVKDAASFQGWKTSSAGKSESVCNRPLLPGDNFILDFGEHITGH